MDSRGCEHVDQGVDGEEVDAASDEAGDARLSGAELLRGFALSQALFGGVLLEREHERGTRLHVFGKSGRLFERVPDTGGARELHLFAVVDGGEDVGEVLLRVLGADLHGFRVVERGCGVNLWCKFVPCTK